MPREYAKNLFSAWSDGDFCNQPIFDKLFFTVLNGQRAVNAAGIQPINFTRWRKAMRDGDRLPTVNELKASLLRMERRGYVFTDEDTGEVLIRSRIRNDGLDKQPTMFLAALRLLAVVDSPKFATVMAAELDRMDVPEVKGDSDYVKNLRAAIARAESDARTHMKQQAERSENPLVEPFEGESLRESPRPTPGPSHGPTQGPSPRPGETGPTPGPSPGGSEGPPVSGSVSGSLQSVDGDLGGSRAHAREADTPPPPTTPTRPEPPRRCKKHRDQPDDAAAIEDPCGPCANYRRAHDRWTTEQTAEQADAGRTHRLAQATARAQATAACELCDHDGYLPNRTLCAHDPAQADTNARGIAAVRAAMAKTHTQPQPETAAAHA